MRANTSATAVALLVALCLGVSGCSYAGLNDINLPGGPPLGSHPIHVTVDLLDAANLDQQSAVKVNDVTVGTVQSITINGWQPQADVVLAQGTVLPANAVAAVRQTGLLGEKYLELSPPSGTAPIGTLRDGAVIPASRTTTGVEVEQVLGALSLLLNGGGIDHIRTITIELGHALDGHTSDARALLTQLDSFTSTLAHNRQTIVDALTGLDRLSVALAAGHREIAAAIEAIPPAVTVLADQRRQLDALLTASTRLADVGSATVQAAQRDLVANLRSLQPILTQLNAAGDSLPRRLEFLLSFPFPNDLLTAIHGDYVNANIQLDASWPVLQKLIAPNGGK